jgi:hypothetical protein
VAKTVAVRIGKRNWLAGLLWTSQERSLSASEIGAEATHLGANLYVQRKPQQLGTAGEAARYDVGYGALAGEHRGTYYSIGSVLCQVRKGRWSGTFELGNGLFLYIAVLDGNSIDPTESGEIVGNRADVETARARHSFMELPHAEHAFTDLEQLLEQFSGQPAKVTFLDGRNAFWTWKLVAGAAVVAVLAVGTGFFLYSRHVAALARQASLDAYANRQRLMNAANASGQLDPLIQTPLPGQLLVACEQAVESLPIASNGWRVESIGCSLQAASIVWKSTGTGWGEEGRPVGVLSDDGSTVVARLPFSLAKGTDAQLPMDRAIDMLRNMAAQVRAVVDIRSAPATALPNPLPGAPAGASAAAAHKQQAFQVRLPWAPWSFPFDTVPGLRIDSVKFSGTEWTVEGSIYGT